MNIGKRLRELRKAKGLSQGDIRRRSGLQRSYVSRVEGGYAGPSLATLERWARALGVRPYEVLLARKVRPKPLRLPKAPPVKGQERKLVEVFEMLSRADQRALLSVARLLGK